MHIYLRRNIFTNSKPNVVIAIMTQLPLKEGVKEWGDKTNSASKSNMKHLDLRKTFIPMHKCDMIYK